MKKTLLTLCAFGFVLVACNNHENHEHEDHSQSEVHEHEHEATDQLSLNGSEKWIVNPEMIVHIRTIESELSAYEASTKPNELANILQENINKLTQSCTMEGAAHDALHLWLMPFITQVQDLSNTTDDTKGKALILELKDAMKTFNQFFE
jgi:uncharacterized lipoprotein NlpE involved in copper resistance